MQVLWHKQVICFMLMPNVVLLWVCSLWVYLWSHNDLYTKIQWLKMPIISEKVTPTNCIFQDFSKARLLKCSKHQHLVIQQNLTQTTLTELCPAKLQLLALPGRVLQVLRHGQMIIRKKLLAFRECSNSFVWTRMITEMHHCKSCGHQKESFTSPPTPPRNSLDPFPSTSCIEMTIASSHCRDSYTNSNRTIIINVIIAIDLCIVLKDRYGLHHDLKGHFWVFWVHHDLKGHFWVFWVHHDLKGHFWVFWVHHDLKGHFWAFWVAFL